MTRILLFSLPLLLFFSCSNDRSEDFTVADLKCNNLENPSGTAKNPDLSWIDQSVIKGSSQSAYQIILASNERGLRSEKKSLWNSGKVKSPSTWIRYAGPTLEPGSHYFWKVRIWDQKGNASKWSEPATFITGLFRKEQWGDAKWIGYEEIPDSLLLVPGVHGNGNNLGSVAVKRTIVPYFRKEFQVNKKISRATVFLTGLGQYELYVNGQKIGDRFLSPGWTDYRKTCLYNTFDLTEKILKGANAFGVIVGNGFYNVNRERYRKLVIAYGAPKMIMKLELTYTDGTKEIVVSDNSWKSSPSPITFSSIYGGEDYDARMEQSGWDKPGFDDSKWQQVLLVKEPGGELRSENDYPLKIEETFKPATIAFRQDSIYVYDFGQNASGIVKLNVSGKKGQVLRMTPGELLGEDSLVTQRATGSPYYFQYTLKGDGQELWMPRFSYYGFRYVQVSGAVPADRQNPANKAVISSLQFLHTRNSSPATGSFKCSNELFNSIYTLINWSIKSNLASVATDCPHREKLGWLEQTHLMGNSIKYIYDIHNLYAKIIDDMMEAQLYTGLVPDIAPEFVPFEGGFRDSPEWGSACVILPWYMYEWYGDTSSVRKAYPMMKRYVSYLYHMSYDNILSHGLGDWYDLGPKFPGEAQLTPKELTATAMFFHDAKLLSKMASVLGEDGDKIFLESLAEEIRSSFNNKFLNTETGVYSTGSQTAYAMPLFFGMVDDSLRSKVAGNLADSIISNNKALTAGDVGYRYLLRALEQEGYSQLIFEMNSRNDVPGYGYQLAKGATSLTESWAALKYVSNNHMMLGHLMEWFFSGVGGIKQAPESKSYDEVVISPQIVGDLTWAETSFRTLHGDISSSWKVEKGDLTITVKIPVNCKAVVVIPQSDPDKITESGLPVKGPGEIRVRPGKDGQTNCEVESGIYTFKTSFSK
jgi:alpha-L-rhamnosidase